MGQARIHIGMLPDLFHTMGNTLGILTIMNLTVGKNGVNVLIWK